MPPPPHVYAPLLATIYFVGSAVGIPIPIAAPEPEPFLPLLAAGAGVAARVGAGVIARGFMGSMGSMGLGSIAKAAGTVGSLGNAGMTAMWAQQMYGEKVATFYKDHKFGVMRDWYRQGEQPLPEMYDPGAPVTYQWVAPAEFDNKFSPYFIPPELRQAAKQGLVEFPYGPTTGQKQHGVLGPGVVDVGTMSAVHKGVDPARMPFFGPEGASKIPGGLGGGSVPAVPTVGVDQPVNPAGIGFPSPSVDRSATVARPGPVRQG